MECRYRRTEGDAHRRHEGGIDSVAFSPDGATLASASSDSVCLWDTKKATRKARLTDHIGRITSITFSPDGQTLVSGGGGYMDAKVRLWDVKTGEQKQVLTGNKGGMNNIVFSPDGTACAGASGSIVYLWDVKTGEVKESFTTLNSAGRVWFSPDGTTVASGGLGDCVSVGCQDG